MADKTYKLIFELSDGSSKEVQFTAPQGPQGVPGTNGKDGKDGTSGAAGTDGVGIVDITISEV